VLGSGVDVIYPRENERLYRQIAEQGAVVSEFPLGTGAFPSHFPRRNRIISGLSRAVLVVEASEKSGTLHTVDHALDQGKDVFAIPGSVLSKTNRGSNMLLRDGAKMALSPQDVLEGLQISWLEPVHTQPQKREAAAGNSEEAQLLHLLQTPMRVEDILNSGSLQLDAARLSAMLTILEIRGLIRQFPGKYYQTVTKHLPA